MASCRYCGAQLADDARYCLQCGRRVDAGDAPNNTRFYGVTPASLVLAVAGAAAGVAVVLFALGRWPFGLVVVGIMLLLLLVFLESARRTPRGSVVRSTADALDGFRARATVAAESVATRGRATRQLLELRRELRRMGAVRGRLLFELGDAVYREDDHAAETARERIVELDRLAAQREAEMQEIVDATHRRIERGRLEVQQTEVAAVPQQPETPTPAPGEGNPPEPARIPEQYPPPDEGTPPQPAVIPEPEPAVIPEPGPQSADATQS